MRCQEVRHLACLDGKGNKIPLQGKRFDLYALYVNSQLAFSNCLVELKKK